MSDAEKNNSWLYYITKNVSIRMIHIKIVTNSG